jgi:hypothetical protein
MKLDHNGKKTKQVFWRRFLFIFILINGATISNHPQVRGDRNFARNIPR